MVTASSPQEIFHAADRENREQRCFAFEQYRTILLGILDGKRSKIEVNGAEFIHLLAEFGVPRSQVEDDLIKLQELHRALPLAKQVEKAEKARHAALALYEKRKFELAEAMRQNKAECSKATIYHGDCARAVRTVDRLRSFSPEFLGPYIEEQGRKK